MFGTNCTAIDAPTTLSFTTASISLILCLFTISGNFLVGLAVFVNPNKDLSNPFSYFIVNLAVADMIVGAITEPFLVHYHIKEGLDKVEDDSWMKVVHVSTFISCTASVLNFSLLAYERNLAIVSSMRYRLLFSVRRFLIMVAIVWIISTCLGFMYFLTTFIAFAFIFINIAVAWTLAVFLYSYVKIVRKFKERAEGLPGVSTSDENHARFVQYNKQLTKTYMTMLMVFLSCYIPGCILAYLMNFCETCSCNAIHCFRDFYLLVVLLNSALNPFVYALRFAKFRRAVIKILRVTVRRRGRLESSSETSPNGLFYLSQPDGRKTLTDND